VNNSAIVTISSAPTALLNNLQSGEIKNSTSSGNNSDSSRHFVKLTIPILIIGGVVLVGALAFVYSKTSKERVPPEVNEATASEKITEAVNCGNKILQRIKIAKEEDCAHPAERSSEKVESTHMVKKKDSYELHVDAIDSEDLSTLYDTASQKADEYYFRKSRSVEDAADCGYRSLWENIFGIASSSSYPRSSVT
jgi:hypothetical protein